MGPYWQSAVLLGFLVRLSSICGWLPCRRTGTPTAEVASAAS